MPNKKAKERKRQRRLKNESIKKWKRNRKNNRRQDEKRKS